MRYNNQRDKALNTVPPVVDELSRGMYLMTVDGLGDFPMPLWLILAASLHLDVVRLLGDEIDRPWREMVAFDHLVYQTIKDHTEYHKTPTRLKIAGWNKGVSTGSSGADSVPTPAGSTNAEDVHAILYRDQKPTGKNGVPGSPVHLIDFLAHALEAEIPPQEPDYFLGHRICWTLLRKLKTAIEGDMLKWLGPRYIGKEYQLSFLGGYVFRSLIGDQGTIHGNTTTPQRFPSTDLFHKAAQV